MDITGGAIGNDLGKLTDPVPGQRGDDGRGGDGGTEPITVISETGGLPGGGVGVGDRSQPSVSIIGVGVGLELTFRKDLSRNLFIP